MSDKVAKWIAEEGYPLEYYVAHAFLRRRFSTAQGDFTHDGNGDPREIDVSASMSRRGPADGLIRLYNVIECKWTRNKPWVVLTSPTTHIRPSAIAAQALASTAGSAAIWANAGNAALNDLKLFHSATAGGFGGRQALSSGQDKFYDSLRSVTAASIATANSYNRQIGFEFPQSCVVVFPVIVIDGHLFESRYDADSDELVLEQTNHSRCHWRGSAHSPFWTTIDIVTKEGVPAFVEQRAADFEVLLDALSTTYQQLRNCYDKKDASLLTIHQGPTGMAGYPPFWNDILRRCEFG